MYEEIAENTQGLFYNQLELQFPEDSTRREDNAIDITCVEIGRVLILHLLNRQKREMGFEPATLALAMR